MLKCSPLWNSETKWFSFPGYTRKQILTYLNGLRCPENDLTLRRERLCQIGHTRVLDQRCHIIDCNIRRIGQWNFMSIDLYDSGHLQNLFFRPAIAFEETRNELGNSFAIVAPLNRSATFLAMRFQLNELLPLGRIVFLEQKASQCCHALVRWMRREIVLHGDLTSACHSQLALQLMGRSVLTGLRANRPAASFALDLQFFGKSLQATNANWWSDLRWTTNQWRLSENDFTGSDVTASD